MTGWYIDISNGLLVNGHRKRMGEAVWEFMWFLDHITMIDDEKVGWVYGGKPINLKDIAQDMEVHEVTVSRNIKKLTTNEYIIVIRTPYGLKVGIKKAKKRFRKHGGNSVEKSVNSGKRFNTSANRFNTNAKSNIRQLRQETEYKYSSNNQFYKNKNPEKLKKLAAIKEPLLSKTI